MDGLYVSREYMNVSVELSLLRVSTLSQQPERPCSISFAASHFKNYCCVEWQHSRLRLGQMDYSSEQCFSGEENIQGPDLKGLLQFW